MLNKFQPEFSGEYQIDIFAPPEKVWEWLSRVDLWAVWRQDVSCAYWMEGNGQNPRLKWRIRKMIGFTAEVAVWKRERQMSWQAISYRTRLTYDLKIDGNYRGTEVTLNVTGHGGLLRFFPTRAIFSGQLNRSNEIWLGALKTKLEAGKDDSTSPPSGLESPFENNVQLPSGLEKFGR